MKGERTVAIVGVYEHPTRHAPDRTVLQLHAESAVAALRDAGLTMREVDGLFTTGLPGTPSLVLAEYLGLHPRYMDSTALGGASFAAFARHALGAIQAGLCRVALITYASTPRSGVSRVGAAGRANIEVAPDNYEVPYGPTMIATYALIAQRHIYDYGTRPEQLAQVAVTARRHAALNPHAMYRDPITVQDVLHSRLVCDPLHILDCCVVSDGAGAVVIASREVAQACPKPPIWLLGASEGVVHTEGGKRNFATVGRPGVAQEALGQAGVTLQDFDMAMVYDSFTITVITALEALGFCGPGEGGAFVEGGRIGLGGALPINTDGGGLSSIHPGMRGIFLLIEATRQLRGEFSGTPRQVPHCRLALCYGVGGAIGARQSTVAVVLGRD